MTTDTDLQSGATDKSGPPGKSSPTQTAQSQDIRMNMPDRSAGGQVESGAGAGGQPQENIERLLLKLMGRIDDNDRRYGQALEKLNDRLNTFSQRAQSAGTSSPSETAAALERVHEQASSLAAQVNDAGSARRAQKSAPIREIEQRLTAFSTQFEGAAPPGAGAAVNDDFADVTRRLERSLATGAPGAEFDALTNRMDDLARNMDAALASRNDPGRLQSIESRLDELAASFAAAQQHYGRIENIEGHLLSLMNWTQSAAAPANDGDLHARLDTIERSLQALNENAREMDYRAEDTLNALNEAVEPPASRLAAPGEIDLPLGDGAQYGASDYADVWINESSDVNPAPGPQNAPSRPAHQADNLGANIPDYQPGPAASPEMQSAERRSGEADRRAQSRDRVEPAFEADDDFIASARRAAAAAAAQTPETGAGALRTPRTTGFTNATVEPEPSASKRPRTIFVAAAAAGLLLVSAGILFGQLKNKPVAPAPGPAGQAAPQSPAAAPKAPSAKSNQQSLLPSTGSGVEKQSPARMAPGQHQPASANRAAPAAAPATGLATNANYRAPAPARKSLTARAPQHAISTSTLLASLAPEAARNPLPGVQVTIKQPSGLASTPRSGIAAPALVPGYAVRPNPLAPPKRAPAATGKRDKSRSQPIDSAPAASLSQPMPSRRTAMPPVRIGPQSLRIAAARGSPAAQVEVASRFAEGSGVARNLKKAAEWYKRAAAQGFAPAQYRLAALHERGLGVKKDISLAQSWYRRAAELGNIRAMHNLAVLLTRANPDSAAYTAAKNWFHEAARHGLADSQFNLGVLYESGLGVTKNTAEAYKWFTLAARQGDDEARKRRETIRPQLPERSFRAVERTLRLWKPATPKAAANKTGQPRGGWQSALLPKSANTASTALVTQAQKLLNKLGYDAGVPDGKLGPQTVSAIRKFENRTGVVNSGRVTPKLLQKLKALNS